LNTEPQWLCLRIKPQKEFAAERYFEAMGYETYLPFIKCERNSGGVRRMLKEVKRPLAKGYMFIAMKGFPDWRQIFEKYYVLSAIGHDGYPWYFSDDVIRKLRWRWGKGGATDRRFGRELAKFDIGDKAFMTAGPFAGNEIRIDQISGIRTKGTISALGGEVSIEVDVVDLEAA